MSFSGGVTADVVKERLGLVVECRRVVVFVVIFHFLVRRLLTLTVSMLLVCGQTYQLG